MFNQQISGIINLSLPLIILFNMSPELFQSFAGQVACSLLLGVYICYRGWKQVKNYPHSLKYEPTNEHKELLTTYINECNINPGDIVLRYAYTNESVALANGFTIVIDPVLWHDLNNDPEAIKVNNVFEQHIKPTLSCVQEKRISAIHSALNPAVQRFIFKHELGHVFYKFSYKYLVVVFVIGSLATFSGILAAMTIISINGFAAALLGMFVGGTSDLLLTFISNAVWKLREEKKADQFVAQYSTIEDIEAAALFFEQHQELLNIHKEPENFLSCIPSYIRTGHPNGKSRAKYLLKLASQKSEVHMKS